MELSKGELDALFGLTKPEREAILRLGNNADAEISHEGVLRSLCEKRIVRSNGTRCDFTHLGQLVYDRLLLLREIKNGT
jgi:hypothetical protein